MKYRDEIEKSFGEDMERIGQIIKEWHTNKHLYYPVLIGLEELEVAENERLTVSAGWGLSINAYGDGKFLTKVVRVLRTNGWMTNADRPQKNSPSWSPTFYRVSKEEGNEGRISYDHPLHLYFSSTMCERVQVGTEMKEVPVYEVKCADLTIDDAEPVAATQAPALP